MGYKSNYLAEQDRECPRVPVADVGSSFGHRSQSRGNSEARGEGIRRRRNNKDGSNDIQEKSRLRRDYYEQLLGQSQRSWRHLRDAISFQRLVTWRRRAQEGPGWSDGSAHREPEDLLQAPKKGKRFRGTG